MGRKAGEDRLMVDYFHLPIDADENARILGPVAVEVLVGTANPAAVFCDSIHQWAGDDFVGIETYHSDQARAWLPVVVHARLGRLSPGPVPGDSQLEALARLWIGYASAAICDRCGRRIAALDDGCPPVIFPWDNRAIIRPACQPPGPIGQPDVTSAG